MVVFVHVNCFLFCFACLDVKIHVWLHFAVIFMNKFFRLKKIGDNGEFRRRRNKKIHVRWRLWVRIVVKFFGSEKIGDMGIISENANFFAKIFVEKFITKNLLQKVEWHGNCMQNFMQKIRCTIYVQKF